MHAQAHLQSHTDTPCGCSAKPACFPQLAKRAAGKNVSKMTYFVLGKIITQSISCSTVITGLAGLPLTITAASLKAFLLLDAVPLTKMALLTMLKHGHQSAKVNNDNLSTSGQRILDATP